MESVDIRTAESWLFEEARLIDGGYFEEWLSLFSENGVYWLPIDDRQPPGKTVSIVYDDSLRRRERVFRLCHTRAHAQEPPSNTIHVIGNVKVDQGSENDLVVYSNQIIYEIRAGMADYRQRGLGEQRTFAAQCEHRYVMDAQGCWRIALKKMLLLNREIPIENLTFIL